MTTIGMSGPLLICPRDHVLVPWANGLGTVAGVFGLPPGAAPDAMRLRVTLAPVPREAPFSVLAGTDRWITRLGAGRMSLVFPDGEERVLDRLVPARFDGGRAPRCLLPDGETLVLNVMTRPPVPPARVEALRGHAAPGGEGVLTVLYVHAGIWAAAGLEARGGDTLILPTGTGAEGAGEAVLARVIMGG